MVETATIVDMSLLRMARMVAYADIATKAYDALDAPKELSRPQEVLAIPAISTSTSTPTT
jgi:hypothetical protein